MRGGANPQIKQVLDWLKTQIGQADQVVEEWHDENGFYRKYASGFIEQGGSFFKGNWSAETISLPTNFSSKNYVVTITSYRPNGASFSWVSVDALTISSFKAQANSYEGRYYTEGLYWYACGY